MKITGWDSKPGLIRGWDGVWLFPCLRVKGLLRFLEWTWGIFWSEEGLVWHCCGENGGKGIWLKNMTGLGTLTHGQF